mgnify:CR=1 FL=1
MPNTYTPNLNLPKPGTGDTGWKEEADACADMIDALGNLQSFVVPYTGQAQDEELFFQRKFDQDVTIKKIEISSRDAPVGSAITIDCTLDGAEQTKIATLAAGAAYQSTTLTPFNVTTQLFGLKIKSVGSTSPGGELAITVHYQPKAIATI